jgi:hypothetical protein
MTTPGRLSIGTGGRITGPAVITHNQPFPCVNGRLGVTGATQGVLMHTMVCDLDECIRLFNDPAVQASAHFGIAQDGRIHQFGPLGKGFEAWHAKAANLTWYGIEHADHKDQHNPLTDAQITASAQVVELLSRFAGFPLQVTDDIHGRGYGTHVMGGAAWGGHTCPGPGPRAAQRHVIVELAKVIRAAVSGPPPPKPPPLKAPVHTSRTYVTAGRLSLAELAAKFGTKPMHILHLTCDPFGGFPPEVAEWGNAVLSGDGDPAAPMPAGMHLRVPVAP